jgi:hypothetical protein
MTVGNNKSVRFNVSDVSSVAEARPLIAQGPAEVHEQHRFVPRNKWMERLKSAPTVLGMISMALLSIGLLTSVAGVGLSLSPMAPRHCYDITFTLDHADEGISTVPTTTFAITASGDGSLVPAPLGTANGTATAATLCLTTDFLHVAGCSAVVVHAGCTDIKLSSLSAECVKNLPF